MSKRYQTAIQESASGTPTVPDASQIYKNTPPPIPARQSKLDFSSGKMVIGRATATRTGLSLPDNLTADEFQEIGTQIFTLAGVTQWWIGDYVNFSARYGDVTGQIAEHFGLEVQSIYNIASVVRKFETSRRREVLTFGHHEAVSGKSPELQDMYLTVAVENNMSIKKLRAYIKEQEGSDEKPALPYEPVGADYRQIRSKIAKLLSKPASPKVKKEIAALVDILSRRLAEESSWLEEVQKQLNGSV